jgi:ribosome maturation protein SDO1
MFLPENQKKLTNVSIITLKKFGKKFEIAVYPNKLYEYRHNPAVPLDSILHSEAIYKNLSVGDLASESDLESFPSQKRDDIIRYIIDNGHEQKAINTNLHELDYIEKQILEIIQNKVKFNNSYISKDILAKFVKSVWNIKNIPAKKQIKGIIKKLEEIGFERVKVRVKADLDAAEDFKAYYLSINDCIKEGDFSINDGLLVLKSDILQDFISYADLNEIKYVIIPNEEGLEEEIC